jgi:hypothetical protein
LGLFRSYAPLTRATRLAFGDPDFDPGPAAVLAPGLSVRRGPKASVPSIAHEFLLTLVANMAGQKGYTHDHVSENYTDRPLSRADKQRDRLEPRRLVVGRENAHG